MRGGRIQTYSQSGSSQSEIVSVWVLEKGRWLLREVLSYDHQPAGK
jgi:hypothetical protein